MKIGIIVQNRLYQFIRPRELHIMLKFHENRTDGSRVISIYLKFRVFLLKLESFITHFHKKIFELEKRFSLLGIEEAA